MSFFTVAFMSNATVLLIEDSKELLLLYRKIFSPLDCQIEACTSGNEALVFLHTMKPRLIVSDLSFPDITTEIFFERFMQIDGIESVPMILISGREDLESWKDLFVARHAFKKPADIRQLRESVRSLLTPDRPLEV